MLAARFPPSLIVSSFYLFYREPVSSVRTISTAACIFAGSFTPSVSRLLLKSTAQGFTWEMASDKFTTLSPPARKKGLESSGTRDQSKHLHRRITVCV